MRKLDAYFFEPILIGIVAVATVIGAMASCLFVAFLLGSLFAYGWDLQLSATAKLNFGLQIILLSGFIAGITIVVWQYLSRKYHAKEQIESK
jgi:uncharacterized membrane protein